MSGRAVSSHLVIEMASRGKWEHHLREGGRRGRATSQGAGGEGRLGFWADAQVLRRGHRRILVARIARKSTIYTGIEQNRHLLTPWEAWNRARDRPPAGQKVRKVTKRVILGQKVAYLQAGIHPETRFCPLLGVLGALLSLLDHFYARIATFTPSSSLLRQNRHFCGLLGPVLALPRVIGPGSGSPAGYRARVTQAVQASQTGSGLPRLSRLPRPGPGCPPWCTLPYLPTLVYTPPTHPGLPCPMYTPYSRDTRLPGVHRGGVQQGRVARSRTWSF